MNRRAVESLTAGFLLVHGIAIAALVIANAAGTALFQIAVGTSVIDSFAVAFQRPPSAMTSLMGSAGSLLGWSILIAVAIVALFTAGALAVWRQGATARRYVVIGTAVIVGAWLIFLFAGAAPVGGSMRAASLVDCVAAIGLLCVFSVGKAAGPA